MAAPAKRYLTGFVGCVFALFLGIATIGSVVVSFTLFAGANLNLKEEWGILLFQALLVAAPFGALVAARESGRAAWLTAAAMTGLLWSLLAGDALIRRGAGGVNIGLALLMLVSPMIITGCAFAAAALINQRR
jgi:hypothetical protein